MYSVRIMPDLPSRPGRGFLVNLPWWTQRMARNYSAVLILGIGSWMASPLHWIANSGILIAIQNLTQFNNSRIRWKKFISHWDAGSCGKSRKYLRYLQIGLSEDALNRYAISIIPWSRYDIWTWISLENPSYYQVQSDVRYLYLTSQIPLYIFNY